MAAIRAQVTKGVRSDGLWSRIGNIGLASLTRCRPRLLEIFRGQGQTDFTPYHLAHVAGNALAQGALQAPRAQPGQSDRAAPLHRNPPRSPVPASAASKASSAIPAPSSAAQFRSAGSSATSASAKSPSCRCCAVSATAWENASATVFGRILDLRPAPPPAHAGSSGIRTVPEHWALRPKSALRRVLRRAAPQYPIAAMSGLGCVGPIGIALVGFKTRLMSDVRRAGFWRVRRRLSQHHPSGRPRRQTGRLLKRPDPPSSAVVTIALVGIRGWVDFGRIRQSASRSPWSVSPLPRLRLLRSDRVVSSGSASCILIRVDVFRLGYVRVLDPHLRHPANASSSSSVAASLQRRCHRHLITAQG